jgi:hypothetical protein
MNMHQVMPQALRNALLEECAEQCRVSSARTYERTQLTNENYSCDESFSFVTRMKDDGCQSWI